MERRKGRQPAQPTSCILCSLATSESRQVPPSGQKWRQKNMNAKQAIQKCIYQRKHLNFSHLMNISRLLALWRLTSRYCTFFLLPVVGIVWRRRARRRIPQFGRIIYCLEKASTAPLASSLAPTHSSNEKCGKLLSLLSGDCTARLPFFLPISVLPYFDIKGNYDNFEKLTGKRTNGSVLILANTSLLAMRYWTDRRGPK